MTQKRPRFPAQVIPPSTNTANAPVARSSFAPNAQVPTMTKPAVAGAVSAIRPMATEAISSSSQQGARERMVQRLAAAGGVHPMVLDAMRHVPRHSFIDSALVAKAYEDNSLPIGFSQTISKPTVVARMLSLAMEAYGLGRGQKLPGRVLEIGTGCGYQAAVLSQVALEVYSIERIKGMHERARDNLRPMRVANLHLLFGDGMLGYPKGAPYSAIVSAAGGDAIPDEWIDQLAVGGRIIAPTSTAGGQQVLIVVDKTPTGVRQFALESVHFVPLKSGVD